MIKVLYTKPEGYMSKTADEEFANGIDSNTSSEPLECEIKVSLQPLRINIDQVSPLNNNRTILTYIYIYIYIL